MGRLPAWFVHIQLESRRDGVFAALPASVPAPRSFMNTQAAGRCVRLCLSWTPAVVQRQRPDTQISFACAGSRLSVTHIFSGRTLSTLHKPCESVVLFWSEWLPNPTQFEMLAVGIVQQDVQAQIHKRCSKAEWSCGLYIIHITSHAALRSSQEWCMYANHNHACPAPVCLLDG